MPSSLSCNLVRTRDTQQAHMRQGLFNDSLFALPFQENFLMSEIRANRGSITQINVFTALPENQPQNQQGLIDVLTEAAEYLRDVPGALSATIYRSQDGTRVVNYVQYESREAWEMVMAKVRGGNLFGRIGQFGTAEPGLYEVAYTLDK